MVDRIRHRGWLAILLATGCALNPVSGRPELVLTTVESERKVGREETAKLEQTVGFVEGHPSAAYVQEIGRRLAGHSPRQQLAYEFRVVDMAEPNAFALPGGYVFVTRGLLAGVNSEDELANVIGHEIGHAAARHASQRVTLAAPFALVTGLGSMATGLVSRRLGSVVGGVGRFASSFVIAPYSRGQEREADPLGQTMAAEAGWDPAAMPAFLERLGRYEVRQSGGRQEPVFLDSHPSTPERVELTRRFAASLAPASTAPIADGRGAFLERLDGLRVGADPGEGVFIGRHFFHPALDFALRFPTSWKKVNAPTFVAAAERRGKASIVLQLRAEGDDPLAAAAVFADETDARLDTEPTTMRINGLRAARAHGTSRRASFTVTWIAYGDAVYEILGVSKPDAFAGLRSRLEAVAESFRPLSIADRDKILDSRLRIVRVREGETLDELIVRTNSTWDALAVLLANDVRSSRDVRPGDLLKVAVPERYEAPPPRAAGDRSRAGQTAAGPEARARVARADRGRRLPGGAPRPPRSRGEDAMCRNIKTLFNFEPPATEEEIRASSVQFVRKLSGFTRPSKANEAVFERAVEDVARVAHELLDALVTTAPPRDREVEAERARARAAERFG